MYDWVQKLLNLQDKDQRIAKLQEQIRSVPAEKANAKTAIEDDDAALSHAKERVQTCEKAIKNLEIEVETLTSKRRDFESKSLMIKDNTEYRKALHQIDHCKEQVGQLEDRELELMEDLEAARDAYQKQKKEHEATQKRISQTITDLDVRLKNCTAQIEKIKATRAEALVDIPSDILRRYERILKSRLTTGAELLAFAPINNNETCGFCHMNVPPQVRMDARKGQVVSCGQCGVLLYWNED